MDPLFRLLGATEKNLPHVKLYMAIWYAGVVAVIMPLVGDSSMRAMGIPGASLATVEGSPPWRLLRPALEK